MSVTAVRPPCPWLPRCLGTLALLAAWRDGAAAQSVSPELSAMMLTTRGNGSRCQAPSIVATQADWSGVSATAYSAPVARATRFGTTTPVVAVATRTPGRRGWSLMLSGAVGSAATDCMDLAAQPRAQLQLVRTLGNGGMSVGYGYRSLSSLDPTRDRQGLTVAAWQRVRGVHAAFDLRALDRAISLEREVWGQPLALFTDSASIPGPSRQTMVTHAQLRSVDLRSRFQFHAGPVLFDITGGSTVSQRVRSLPWMQDTLFTSGARATSAALWGRTEAQVPVSRWLRLRAGVAALPTLPDTRSPTRTVYSLSVHLARWRRDDDTRALSDDHAKPHRVLEALREDSAQIRLRLRHADASSVRVSGEPTRWAPVTMVRARDDWWEVTLPVGPGTYRLNISIDEAAWQPPPGWPTTRDEFGGRVGLVTVR